MLGVGNLALQTYFESIATQRAAFIYVHVALHKPIAPYAYCTRWPRSFAAPMSILLYIDATGSSLHRTPASRDDLTHNTHNSSRQQMQSSEYYHAYSSIQATPPSSRGASISAGSAGAGGDAPTVGSTRGGGCGDTSTVASTAAVPHAGEASCVSDVAEVSQAAPASPQDHDEALPDQLHVEASHCPRPDQAAARSASTKGLQCDGRK